jgi:Aldo/keto reductase family/NMT1/THI5 like
VQEIRIATANRGAGTAPVFATVAGGYFKDEGLEVELIPHAGHHRSLRALLAGEAEFTNAVAAELIRANVIHGGDAVIIASAISRSAQQVSARPGLSRREDLRGKRWGVQARGDADECSIVMAFDRWGWDPAKDAWHCKDHVDRVRQLRPIADRLGVTRAQLALAWLLERPHLSSVITGAVSVEQVESNLRAADLTLPADVRHAIEAIFPLEVAP